ncbi:selection and upkeep of intraepithelial T-cells protein 1-like [Saccopteryx leptura]|uniref:selection and upkeep of intraepithelial T-cells protein 1-like n=1 Tax=Saccopteryx leptura TaxID=249018 RepID=UPI00339C57BF
MKAARTCLNFEWIKSYSGVMESPFSFVSGYFATILLLQMVLTSEQFTVSSSRSHQVVMVGGHAELGCQLSPPQSAEHMQVGWYRDHYQLVSVYKKEKELSEKSAQNYMNRTVFLKDALKEGRMTLRIHNISVSDEGKYHCFFKDGGTSEEASMDLKVAALGLDIQINVQVLDKKGLMVQCNSEGWFPQPRMQWRDSRGNIIPASSKIFSLDGAGLLHLNMSVLLEDNSHGSVTCCLLNPVTGQEKRAGIALPDILFKPEFTLTMSCMNVCLLMYFITVQGLLYFRPKVLQDKYPILFEIVFECLPFLIHSIIFFVYWKCWNRVFGLDDLALFYSTWTHDMVVILTTLMIFFTLLIFGLLYTLRDSNLA